MDITYSIIATDGLQYGPITLEQLKAWIGENRLNGETQVLRSDANAWLPAADYAELGLSRSAAPPVATAVMDRPAPAVIRPAGPDPFLLRRARTGATWFIWIAALSLINSISASTGAGLVFVVGLGLTQIIDGFAASAGSTGVAVGWVLNGIVAGLFILFGVFGRKLNAWAFVAGMILYGLDGLLFVLLSVMGSVGPQWLSIGFHAFALYRIFSGFQACRQLKA